MAKRLPTADEKSYRRIRQAQQKDRLDRATWADTTSVFSAYDVTGSGSLITEEISFGVVFDGVPFFSYGVERVADTQELVDGDYPFVAVGVSEWITTEPADPDTASSPIYYLGAKLYVNVVSTTQYNLRLRLLFEGTGFKNTQFFRGTA